MIQVIGTLVTDGNVLSLGLGAGFERLPIEEQRDILKFSAQFIAATVEDMNADIEALKAGAAVNLENAAIEGDAA